MKMHTFYSKEVNVLTKSVGIVYKISNSREQRCTYKLFIQYKNLSNSWKTFANTTVHIPLYTLV